MLRRKLFHYCVFLSGLRWKDCQTTAELLCENYCHHGKTNISLMKEGHEIFISPLTFSSHQIFQDAKLHGFCGFCFKHLFIRFLQFETFVPIMTKKTTLLSKNPFFPADYSRECLRVQDLFSANHAIWWFPPIESHQLCMPWLELRAFLFRRPFLPRRKDWRQRLQCCNPPEPSWGRLHDLIRFHRQSPSEDDKNFGEGQCRRTGFLFKKFTKTSFPLTSLRFGENIL